MNLPPPKRPRLSRDFTGSAPRYLQPLVGGFGGRCRSATAALVFLLCSQAWAQITVDLRTDHAAGTYSFPIAPVLNAGHTLSNQCYHHSEGTSGTTGDSNVALCSATYKWTLSAAGSSFDASVQVYRLEIAAGGDPSITSPSALSVEGVLWYSGTCGALKPGMWCYGDVDTLGYNTPYVVMLNMAIPDPDDASYSSDGTVTAVYGQGARTKAYCTTGGYDRTTGALTCTGNFLLYGYTSGDRILVKHSEINANVPTWVLVSSKTSADAIVVPTGLGTSATLTNVTIYSHVDPYTDFRFVWTFEDSLYSYQNMDDRIQAGSTEIPVLNFRGPVAAPLLASNGVSTRSEDYSLTVYDDLHGISSHHRCREPDKRTPTTDSILVGPCGSSIFRALVVSSLRLPQISARHNVEFAVDHHAMIPWPRSACHDADNANLSMCCDQVPHGFTIPALHTLIEFWVDYHFASVRVLNRFLPHRISSPNTMLHTAAAVRTLILVSVVSYRQTMPQNRHSQSQHHMTRDRG